jgi:hypothetical protein
MSSKYALFTYDDIHGATTFAAENDSKEALIVLANKKFHNNLWFAIYKFSSHEYPFGCELSATRWDLDHKFAGETATIHCANYTPMRTAYRLNEHTWFFKTL